MVNFASRANSSMTGLPTEQAVADRRVGNPKRDRIRNAIVIILGEFCGTFMFLLLSFIGAQTALVTNSPSDPDTPLLPFSLMYIAASFGTALAVNVWIFYRVSGGMFNPAVSETRTRLLF
jgi:aquaporin related protein